MIGILYSIGYIEEHFPWAVQKYKDKDGEPTKALYGIPVNASSCNSLWGCAHTIEGPVCSNFMGQYKECYVIKGPAFNGAIIPADFFERVENDSATVINYKEESTKEEKKVHKVTVRKVTNDHDYFCYLAKKYGYNLSKPAPLPRRN